MFIFFLSVFQISAAISSVPSWQDLSKNLYNYPSPQYNRAVVQLKLIPNLNSILKLELSTKNKFLALQTISSLHRVEFIDDLLQLVRNNDRDFQTYVTLNSLAASTYNNEIVSAYLRRIENNERTTPAALKIAIFNGLINQGKAPPLQSLLNTLQDPSFELRIAAVQLALHFSNNGDQKQNYTTLFENALELPPFQLRMLAIEGLTHKSKKLSPAQQKKMLSTCLKDKNMQVRTFCQNEFSQI